MAYRPVPVIIGADFVDGRNIFELLVTTSTAEGGGTDVMVGTDANLPLEQTIGMAMLVMHSVILSFRDQKLVGKEYDALLALTQKQMYALNERLRIRLEDEPEGDTQQ